MADNAPKNTDRDWGKVIGGVFGWGLYAFGLVIWLFATPITAVEKFQANAIDVGSGLLVVALVAYTVVSGVALLVLNSTFGSRHLGTTIAFWAFIVLLVAGSIVVIAEPPN